MATYTSKPITGNHRPRRNAHQLKGKLGDGDSEVIRNIVIAHLTEKGYLLKPKTPQASVSQIADELDIHDTMLTSLVEVLEEKGQLRFDEWENRIKTKLHKQKKS